MPAHCGENARMLNSIVIVGAGQAGYQTAASLRQDGFAGRITLVGDEPGLPYQRPPLSKAYMLGKVELEGLQFRTRKFFDEQAITLLPGRAEAIDRTNRRVAMADGSFVDYDHLVLALGAHNRQLPVPGMALDGVFGLRTLADADRVIARLGQARDVVVCGAGFIGLEFAAVARALDCKVHVLELADRPMARAVSAQTAGIFRQAHEDSGVVFDFGQGLARIEGEGRAQRVTSTGGRELAADIVMFGVGVLPNVHIAEEAGLHIDNGIKVDSSLLSSDPSISAIGDCASFPSRHADARIRLESVQNAADQARCVAARLAGKAHQPYGALPWFWSDQGPMRLQIAGLSQGFDTTVPVGDQAARQFSVLCFRGDTLLAVESINKPGDHMAARKILARDAVLAPRDAAQPGFDLRAFEAATR